MGKIFRYNFFTNDIYFFCRSDYLQISIEGKGFYLFPFFLGREGGSAYLKEQVNVISYSNTNFNMSYFCNKIILIKGGINHSPGIAST